MDALVERCTSENNTQEDWDTVIEICDKVNRDSSLGRQVVNLIIKKLSHRNLNVVLYSLTLANSVVQNCSTTVKQEISSRSFLQPLVKMLHGNVHVTVRNRILNLIQTWTDDFKGQPSLDYINQVYKDLKEEGFEFPVNVPSPKRAAANQKEKEEEEFQLALAMSLSENQPAQVLPKATAQEQTPIQPKRSEKQSIFQVRALYDFDPTDAGELALKKGDVINVHDNTTYPDWWKGSIGGEIGIFPANYVEKITSGEAKNQFGGVIEVDENEYLLRNLEAVRLLRKQIAEADPLGHDSAENDRIQVPFIKVRLIIRK